MNFEVRRGSEIMMQTYNESCIPNKMEREILRNAGYKLYLNNKPYNEKQTVNLNKNSDYKKMQDEQMSMQLSFWNEGEYAVE